MNPVLFDTNVVSELMKPRPEGQVVRFIDAHANSYLSVITLHELIFGAERAPGPKRRAQLLSWVASLRARFASRIVEIDSEIAENSGRLRATAGAAGFDIDPMDALIAACAISRGATVATRNVKDFEPLGVPVVNPWAS